MYTSFLRGCAQRISLLAVFLCLPLQAYAQNFLLPPKSQALVGKVEYIYAANGDTATSIAQRYNLGLNAIIAANPGVAENTVFPAGTIVKIANNFLLPPLPRKGIVINLPEMRLYYYPNESDEVMTFPVGIGRIGKTIPLANTAIVRKALNPIWTPTPSIRKYNEEQGIDLPRFMPAGPDNPLGPYAIYLRIPTYLIHSTIFPESIGRRASFGCIRMNEDDIKQFFPLVATGVPVTIIDMPNKIAWDDNQLYLEAHPPLEEHSDAAYASLAGIVRSIEEQTPPNQVVLIDWPLVAYLAEQPDGIPHAIGIKIN